MAGSTGATRSAVESYKYLVVWQKGCWACGGDVYRVTKSFPENERYGLVGQLRRSAVSVPSNIAEGQGRATRGEFLQFLGHAQGSLFELETQIIISAKLGYIADESEERLKSKITEVARILNGLLTSLGAKTRPSTT